jgi:hypothetical protein
MANPTDGERLAALERYARHLARRLDALNQKLAGLDLHHGGLLRDAQERLRRLERIVRGE